MNQCLKFIILSFLFLGACQTSMISNFKKIQPGFGKPDVMEAIGTPDRVDRFQGKDRWGYTIYENGIRYQREVHFYNGKVVYSGTPVKNKVSAEIEDKNFLNQEEELKQLEKIQSETAPPKARNESEYKSDVEIKK